MDEINIVEKITQACKLLDEVDEYVKDLDDKHSVCDMRLSDMYHLIENNNVDEWSKSDLRNVTKEIKAICEVRRKVKVDIGLRKIYQDNIGKLNNQSNRALLLEKIYKGAKCYNTDYSYRVYTETEISDLVKVKPDAEEAPDYHDKIQEEFSDDLV